MPAKTHGMSHTLIYDIWSQMRQRCDNSNNKNYCYYGGIGITYDPKWRTFEGFYEDMKDGYSEHLTIDRIDTNGNYTKENCRWITMSKQQENKSNNVLVNIRGELLTLNQISKKYNLEYDIIAGRYHRGELGEKLISLVKDKSLKQSNVKGVTWHKKQNKWNARIMVDYKMVNLGSFEKLEDAIKCRKEAELKYFGNIITNKSKVRIANLPHNSDCKGVLWHKNRSIWVARITYNKQIYYLGQFNNFSDAVKARLQAEIKFYGKESAPQKHLFEQYSIC
jgi:hypothetical protein